MWESRYLGLLRTKTLAQKKMEHMWNLGDHCGATDLMKEILISVTFQQIPVIYSTSQWKWNDFTVSWYTHVESWPILCFCSVHCNAWGYLLEVMHWFELFQMEPMLSPLWAAANGCSWGEKGKKIKQVTKRKAAESTLIHILESNDNWSKLKVNEKIDFSIRNLSVILLWSNCNTWEDILISVQWHRK